LLTGIENINKDEPLMMEISPNPFTNDISITIYRDNITEATFRVSTMTGQVVITSQEQHLHTGYVKTLDLSDLPAGIYLLQVVADGETVTRQIVKSK
jgi:hypothetical protein